MYHVRIRKNDFKIPCWFFLLPVLFCLTACRSEPRPAGLPKLYPATITFMQEGQPLVEATVTLIAQDATIAKWVVGGITDAKGVLQVKTHAKFVGAPAGKFKITVSKTEISHEEAAQLGNVNTSVTHYVDLVAPKFQTAESTSLEIEITAGKNSATFDLGEPVRIPLQLPFI